MRHQPAQTPPRHGHPVRQTRRPLPSHPAHHPHQPMAPRTSRHGLGFWIVWNKNAFPYVAAGAGGLSLTVTAGMVVSDHLYQEGATLEGALALVEAGVLAVLGMVSVRIATDLRSILLGAVPAGVAVPAWLLRFGRPDGTVLAALGAWSLLTVLSVVVGLYLRSLDERRRRSVREARRAQRLELAHD